MEGLEEKKEGEMLYLLFSKIKQIMKKLLKVNSL